MLRLIAHFPTRLITVNEGADAIDHVQCVLGQLPVYVPGRIRQTWSLHRLLIQPHLGPGVLL